MWPVAATLVQTENISIIAENTGQWCSRAVATQQISVESYCNASSDIPNSRAWWGPGVPISNKLPRAAMLVIPDHTRKGHALKSGDDSVLFISVFINQFSK